VEGLADPSAFSFRLSGEKDLYLLVQDDALVYGVVGSESERRRATFQVHN
jgi:hypothetical protein